MTRVVIKSCACGGTKTLIIDGHIESTFLDCICNVPELQVVVDLDTEDGAALVGYPIVNDDVEEMEVSDDSKETSSDDEEVLAIENIIEGGEEAGT